MKHPPVHYHDYLELERLLSSQKRRSEAMGHPAHDEWLFITVHQTYELWFKQILHELDSALASLGATPIPERAVNSSVRRLERVLGILRLSLGNIDVLETMTPLDFLDFRDYLYPASGFQSFQFRLIETKLGLREDDRMLYNQSRYYDHLPPAQRELVITAQGSPSLFDLVEKWLERTPFLQIGSYDFWASYRKAVEDLLAGDRQTVLSNPNLTPESREKNVKMLEMAEGTFQALFDRPSYEDLRTKGQFRLSAEAMQAALFIQVYRDEPILQEPFRLLSALIDLDEVMATWRYRHAQMAQRMLGRKVGTGGSSGSDYLRETADRHRIFGDFTRLATFLIPRSRIPALPPELRGRLDYATTS